MKRFWAAWVKIAEIIGNAQMIVILTAIYWTMLLIVAVPFKLFSDPLLLKPNKKIEWHKRPVQKHDLESLRRQG